MGVSLLCRVSWRCWRTFWSASRARRARSSITSRGRPGGSPLQSSGSRSMNSRSAADMEFTVTLRASAMRSPLPSGSRRAALTMPDRFVFSRSRTTSTGRRKVTTMMPLLSLTVDSTSSARVKTMRAKPFSTVALTSPLTGCWAAAGNDTASTGRRRNAASEKTRIAACRMVRRANANSLTTRNSFTSKPPGRGAVTRSACRSFEA